MTKAENLRDKANKASRIQQVLNSNGWEDIKEIIQNKYDSAMNDLLAKETPEARGAINAITEIMNDISAELKFGEMARSEYKKKYLDNQMPNEG